MKQKGWNQGIIESISRENQINFHRMIIALAAVAFPVSGILYKKINPTLYDPMIMRWILFSFSFLIVGLSYWSKLARKYFERLCYVLIYFISTWLFMLNMANDFPIEFSLIYIVTIVICISFFSNLCELNVYVGVISIFSYLGIWIIAHTQVDKYTFLFNFTALCITAYLIAQKKIHAYRNVIEKNIFIKTIFEKSANAMLVLNEEDLKIIDCNEKAIALFHHKKNELLKKTIYQLFRTDTTKEMTVKEIKKALNDKEIVCINKKFYNMWLDISIKKIHALQKSYILANIVDISVHKKHQEKIEYWAYRDALTNLHNRRYGKELLGLAIEKAQEEDTLLGIMFIDLDGFKDTNDIWGHDVGDSLLKHVAKRLKTTVRNEDTVVRLGGDEFMMIIDKVYHRRQVLEIAERLIKNFSQPFRVKENSIHITCSIGIAVFPEHGNEMKTLLKNADCAMYAAKKSGRNNFKLFTAEVKEENICYKSSN
ncbi:sensor domain-containing diguanylate cyclase [Clostridiaceae bacterium 35-E11]